MSSSFMVVNGVQGQDQADTAAIVSSMISAIRAKSSKLEVQTQFSEAPGG